VFENSVLRLIFGPKRNETIWMELHNEKLLFFSKYNQNDHVKEGEMGRACGTQGEEEHL
jgi:hypothetical protein